QKHQSKKTFIALLNILSLNQINKHLRSGSGFNAVIAWFHCLYNKIRLKNSLVFIRATAKRESLFLKILIKHQSDYPAVFSKQRSCFLGIFFTPSWWNCTKESLLNNQIIDSLALKKITA